MELQKIRELIEVFKTSELAEFEFAEGDRRVRFVRRSAPSAAGQTPKSAVSPAAEVHVRSPLFGIVHLTPSPTAPPFVRPGDLVEAGQTVCIVEAMKVFHEVKTPRKARIAEVLVRSADEVEAGAMLMSLAEVG